MIIVTSGQPFTDIDALACAIAYNELLNLENRESKAVLPGPLNKSVTKEIRSWKFNFDTEYKPSKKDKFVLVDISEPGFFANFVFLDQVMEVIDHRYGFEEFWKKRIGASSQIEMVGSCATLIWEKIVKKNHSKEISEVSANLLYAAIASNTLNFQASITTKRDKKAFEEIEKYTNLSINWIEKYFLSQDKEKLENVYEAIVGDTKNISGPVIGQLEMWNSRLLFKKYLHDSQRAMESFGKTEWFLTSPSISEGFNYIFTNNKNIKTLLEKIIDIKFEGNIGTTKKLWLRKEIAKKIKEAT